ncbi:hypothetical protein D3C80_1807230 [compost metagenome]
MVEEIVRNVEAADVDNSTVNAILGRPVGQQQDPTTVLRVALIGEQDPTAFAGDLLRIVAHVIEQAVDHPVHRVTVRHLQSTDGLAIEV